MLNSHATPGGIDHRVDCGRFYFDDARGRNPHLASAPMTRFLQRFWRGEDGATATEYAVMLALIVVICLAALVSLGEQSRQTFETIEEVLEPADS